MSDKTSLIYKLKEMICDLDQAEAWSGDPAYDDGYMAMAQQIAQDLVILVEDYEKGKLA